MTRCESYPLCSGTIYFPTAPLFVQVSTPIGKCENYIKLANNFMLPNKYLNEKIVQVSVQKLLSNF